MMENFTQISFFTFNAYFDSRRSKYIYFVIVISLHTSIVFSNLLLIVLICVNRSLHEPMYMFLCSLFVNELYGSTGLFPFLLLQILSDIHTVSTSFCFLQIFSLYSYGIVEFTALAVMSYDRYLAICYPLQYKTLMTFKKVALLIATSWFFPFLTTVILILLIVPLKLCGNIINKVYCDNYAIVKLSCFDTTLNNIYGLLYASLATSSLLSLIFYTYIKILKVCFSGSKEMRQKAVSTCMPHLASLLNFAFGCLFEIVQSRFNMKSVPHMSQIFLSLYFFMCQPIFNPVMYGLNNSKLRIICKNLLFDKMLGHPV